MRGVRVEVEQAFRFGPSPSENGRPHGLDPHALPDPGGAAFELLLLPHRSHAPAVGEGLAQRVWGVVQGYPAYGIRKVWAVLAIGSALWSRAVQTWETAQSEDTLSERERCRIIA